MVIRIKKRVLTVALALLALFVVAVVGSASPAQADPCTTGEVKVIVVGSGLSVCVPTGELPTITVTLPRATTTVTLPRVTVTKTRTIPKATTTVFIPRVVSVPRTIVRTRTVNVPGPVSTTTVTVSRGNAGQFGSTPRQTVTERATITASPVTTTVTLPPEVRTDTVTVTKIKATAISLLLLIIGAILALLLLRAAYTYGWIRGDDGNRAFLKEVTDDLRFKE